MHLPRSFSASLAKAILALSCALTACSGNSQVIYTGTLQPGAGTCEPPARATLELRGGDILFIPRDGTLILHGSVAADGAMQAETTLPGMDHKPYRLVFTAPPRQTATIEGRYATPRCAYAIRLTRTQG